MTNRSKSIKGDLHAKRNIIFHSFYGHAFAFLLILSFSGCAHGEHHSPNDLPGALERSKVQEDEEARVTVTALSGKESRQFFGVPLARYGIQPVWIEIKNKNETPYYFFQRFVDESYFSPEEAARISRFRIVKPGTLFSLPSILMLPFNLFRYKYLNEKMSDDFREYALHNTVVLPGKEISGFIFTPRDKGTKKVPIRLLGEEKEKKLLFIINLPDIKQDYKKSGIEDISAQGEPEALSLDELHKKLEAMDCCTTNRRGTKTGDPLNFVIVAQFQDLLDAFTLAQWDETEVLSLASASRMMKSFLTGEEYRYSPVSNLYFQGRKHDVAFQKTRDNIDERLHLRLWLMPYRVDGVPVWVGQVSRDIGVRFTRSTWNLMTHKIDADIDESRDYVFADLSVVQRLGRFGYVTGAGEATRTKPRRNLTGDPYYTDGHRLVTELTASDTDPVSLGWKFPLEEAAPVSPQS